MSFDRLYPSPGNPYSPTSIGKTDDQQRMSESNLGIIQHHPDFSQVSKLRFQPLSGNRSIPVLNPDCTISQEPFQSPYCAQELCFSGYFVSNPAQCYQSALVDPGQQKDKVPYFGDPLSRSQFSNSSKPWMILVVDWHGSPTDKVYCGKSTLPVVSPPISYSFVKVSGS